MSNKERKTVSLSDESIKIVEDKATKENRSFSQALDLIVLNSKSK